ncbi:MAG: type II toxin-antitoxin system Phd/YefM family antitoxin [Planctomycetes bacterium]|nr:type II toxin-antitoxin system Phd/YefM family antitoxin [Planctomycetota bacterium]
MAVRAQSVSYVKAHLAQVIDEVRDGGGPMIVTQNGATAAIIQDPESYERNQQALAMLKLVAMAEEDIRKGRVHTHAEVFAAVRKKIAAVRKAKT